MISEGLGQNASPRLTLDGVTNRRCLNPSSFTVLARVNEPVTSTFLLILCKALSYSLCPNTQAVR